VAPAAQSSEASDRSADGQLATRGFAGRSSGLVAPPGSPSRDPAVRLRAAAAIGLTAEIETLLAQGVPVDAPDRDGDTALMKAIQADRPAAAALLRKHGASLDRKNRAGVSARDMAGARADPALDEAIGQTR